MVITNIENQPYWVADNDGYRLVVAQHAGFLEGERIQGQVFKRDSEGSDWFTLTVAPQEGGQGHPSEASILTTPERTLYTRDRLIAALQRRDYSVVETMLSHVLVTTEGKQQQRRHALRDICEAGFTLVSNDGSQHHATILQLLQQAWQQLTWYDRLTLVGESVFVPASCCFRAIEIAAACIADEIMMNEQGQQPRWLRYALAYAMLLSPWSLNLHDAIASLSMRFPSPQQRYRLQTFEHSCRLPFIYLSLTKLYAQALREQWVLLLLPWVILAVSLQWLSWVITGSIYAACSTLLFAWIAAMITIADSLSQLYQGVNSVAAASRKLNAIGEALLIPWSLMFSYLNVVVNILYCWGKMLTYSMRFNSHLSQATLLAIGTGLATHFFLLSSPPSLGVLTILTIGCPMVVITAAVTVAATLTCLFLIHLSLDYLSIHSQHRQHPSASTNCCSWFYRHKTEMDVEATPPHIPKISS